MASDLRRSVTVRGLTRSFDGRAVVDGLDLSLAAGQFTVLLGPPGAGKSTLLRVLAGLDREVSGTVLVPRRRTLAPQQPPSAAWRRVWRGPARHASLVRVLDRESDLLLLDEPFAALDPAARTRALRLVGEAWRRRGCTVLLACRDVDTALLLADRVLVLRDGAIAYDTAVGPHRARTSTDPAFAALRARLLAEVAGNAGNGGEGGHSGDGEDGGHGALRAA
ncbi:ATP-binding cassette domain-containing protein [Streptomyces sp. NPDC048659]|uniref:ATP-binding cassette domain-containing protein n=1 Tax=Streptomyces sp. NPDC048659 TaxID=3155489 RepID=UPI0034471FA5